MCNVRILKRYKPFLYTTFITKVVSNLNKKGKKSLGYLILLKALYLIKLKMPFLNPFFVLKTGLMNIMPLIQLRLWIKSGKSYRIPYFVEENRRLLLSIKWLVVSSQERSENSMAERLANEIIDSFFYKGLAVKKKLDLYEIASLNRPFITFLPWDRSFAKNRFMKRNVKKIIKRVN